MRFVDSFACGWNQIFLEAENYYQMFLLETIYPLRYIELYDVRKMALESESLEFAKFHCDVCNPYGITLIVEDKSEKVNELCPTSKTRSSRIN